MSRRWSSCQDGSCEPVPACSRLDRSPPTVFSRRSVRNDRSAGRPAKSGWASQSSRNALEAVALDAGGGGQILLATLLPLGRVLDAGGGTEQHEPAHELRAGRARRGGRSAHPSSSRGRWPRRPDRRSGDHRRAARPRPPRIVRDPARRPARPRGPSARASTSGPQHRPVCVKPWTSTSVGPRPRRSACRNMAWILADRVWSDVGDMAAATRRPPGDLLRHPGRRVGP